MYMCSQRERWGGSHAQLAQQTTAFPTASASPASTAASQAIKDPFETESVSETIGETSETQSTELSRISNRPRCTRITRRTYEFANEVQDTSEKQTNSGEDLTERTGQEPPQWAQLLFRMRHAFELGLGAFDRVVDISSQLL